MRKLLIFHPIIAPYRVDFFNNLYKSFNTVVCLKLKNLLSQNFNYTKVSSEFIFKPIYLKELIRIRNRSINVGYYKYLNRFKPDIVIVGEFGLDCIIVLLHKFLTRSKYKVISICDDSYNMVVENNDFSLLHRSLRKFIVPLIDDLILVEPSVTEWYNEHYGKGVFFPIIKNEELASSYYEKLLPLSKKTLYNYNLENKFVFLFVGRLVSLKNVKMIIESYSQIANSSTALVIIGNGPEEDSLKHLADSLGIQVLFLGRLEGDNLMQWYNISNCLILASTQEAFGAVTNEALLAGCFGLISNKAGSQCLIKNGVNGYTFSPYDGNDLVQKMHLIIDIHRKENSPQLVKRDSKMLYTFNELFDTLVKKIIS